MVWLLFADGEWRWCCESWEEDADDPGHGYMEDRGGPALDVVQAQ